MMFRQALKVVPTVSKFSFARSAARPFVLGPMMAQFSTSISRMNAPDAKTLVQQELDYEKNDAFDLDPSFVAYMKNENIKAIEPNEHAFSHMIKEWNDEKVHVLFDIQKITFATHANKQINEEIGSEEDQSEVFSAGMTETADLSVVLEKNGKALQFDLDLSPDEYHFTINGVRTFDSVDLALDYSSNSVDQKDLLYSGPLFENLSLEMQDMFYDLLRERGVDEELGELLVAYATWKENNMYIDWLEKLQSFV
ncbi:hypothetical protein KL906_000790 [Ogataea polymorpha]|nr:hypothetical protein KL906_000790 [Ogataea polymorpha]